MREALEAPGLVQGKQEGQDLAQGRIAQQTGEGSVLGTASWR